MGTTDAYPSHSRSYQHPRQKLPIRLAAADGAEGRGSWAWPLSSGARPYPLSAELKRGAAPTLAWPTPGPGSPCDAGLDANVRPSRHTSLHQWRRRKVVQIGSTLAVSGAQDQPRLTPRPINSWSDCYVSPEVIRRPLLLFSDVPSIDVQSLSRALIAGYKTGHRGDKRTGAATADAAVRDATWGVIEQCGWADSDDESESQRPSPLLSACSSYQSMLLSLRWQALILSLRLSAAGRLGKGAWNSPQEQKVVRLRLISLAAGMSETEP